MTTGPRALLHRCHRLALWQTPLWVLVAALGLDFVLAQSGVDWPVRAWTLGFALVAALGARLLFPPSLRATACALDARAGTCNRFEALAALEGRTDPLAKAVESETAAHLERRPLPGPHAWLASLALLVALIAPNCLLLSLASLLAFSSLFLFSCPSFLAAILSFCSFTKGDSTAFSPSQSLQDKFQGRERK